MAINIIKIKTPSGDLARIELEDGTELEVMEFSIDRFDASGPMTAVLRVPVNEIRTEEKKVVEGDEEDGVQ